MKTTPDPTMVYDARLDSFERRLNHVSEDKRGPIVAVADTAYVALGWLQSNGLEFTAADVLRMTEMILARETEEDAAMGALLAPHGQRQRA